LSGQNDIDIAVAKVEGPGQPLCPGFAPCRASSASLAERSLDRIAVQSRSKPQSCCFDCVRLSDLAALFDLDMEESKAPAPSRSAATHCSHAFSVACSRTDRKKPGRQLCQAAFRRTRSCARLLVSLHAPDRHCQ
jgi:hypothetical protein